MDYSFLIQEIRDCDLVISLGDSLLSYIAGSLDVPYLSILGALNPQMSHCYFDYHVLIHNPNRECSPCVARGFMKACNGEIDCMKDITVEEVIDNVDKLFKLTPAYL